MALPDTYKQVEYIQSSGTQYINTGVTVNSTNRVFRIKYILYKGHGINTVFGTFKQYSENDIHTRFSRNSSNIEWDAYSGNGYGRVTYSRTNNETAEELELGNNYIKDLSTGTTLVTGTASNKTSNHTIPIFGYLNVDNNTYGLTYIRIYYFQIIDNGTLVRDFVPVLRKSDSKPGLYDLVNNVFYTNAGTGEFEYPAQNGKIKKFLLGTNLIRPAGQYNWNLYAETNFKSSSYGGFRTMGWYTDSTPSSIAFNTSEGYIYTTGSHAQCKISPQTGDLTRFENANAIKIVFDGIYLTTNSNSYGSNSRVAGFGLDSNSSTFKLADAGVMTGASCVANTWYSGYSIIEKNGSYDNWITYLSNGSVFKCENAGWKWSNIITSNNWFRSDASDSRGRCGRIYADQASNYSGIRLKDIHLYLAE